MKSLLRIGMLLCMYLLTCVGWAMAQTVSGSGSEGVIFPESASTIEDDVVRSANGLLSARYLSETCGDGTVESEISVFANGNAVRVYEKNDVLYISTNNMNDIFGFRSKDETGFYKVRLYGGSYGKAAEKTEITLLSGAIRNIYGGGRSDDPQQPANVSGTARINVSDGSFSLVCGGGRYYARTNATYICIGTAETPYTGASNYIMAGGMDQGLTTNKDNQYHSSLETNVNAVNTVTMDIYGGKFKEIGAGGGNGYTHTGTSMVNINNATVDYFYGVYSNGIADNVNITITGSTINKEFATVNRGKLVSGTFHVKGDCWFADNALVYMGATTGWSNSDTTGDPLPVVTGEVTYTLLARNTPNVLVGEGVADAVFTVNGPKVKVAKFDRGTAFTGDDRYLKAFTINSRGRWTANVGMTFAKDDDAATLINNGNLSVGPVESKDMDDLYALFDAGVNGIVLQGNQTYTLSKQLVIKKPLKLHGMGATLKADPDAKWPTTTNKAGETVIDNSKANLISIEAGKEADVQLDMIHVRESKAAGINVQTAKSVTLSSSSSMNNATAGLLVHAPVVANRFQTAGNVWGGVNIDKGNNGADTYDYKPSFQFDSNSSFAEELQIWAEAGEGHITNPATAVIVPEVSGEAAWRQVTSDDGKFYAWTNATPHVYLTKEKIGDITYVYANGNAVSVASAGEGLTKITSDTESYTFNDATDKVYLFGGSKGADVETSSISMTGGQLTRIYGGGYMGNVNNATTSIYDGKITSLLVGGGLGTKETPAAVTNMAKLIVVHGDVRYLVAGGDQYASVKQAYVYSDNSTYYWALGGGYAPNDNTINLSTPYEQNGNNVESSTLEINGGQINGAICAGGGFSHAYVKTVNATFNNVVFNGGLYGAGWNGRSENVSVVSKGCTFNMKEGVDPDYRTVAGMIRGMVLDTLTMRFDAQCTFAQNYEAYLGCDRDSEGNPVPYAANAIWTFEGTSLPTVKVSEGMHNVTVTGAPVVVEKFLHQKSSSNWISSFEVPAGNTWAFNGGLKFSAGVNEAALTNKGTIVVPKESVHAVASRAAGTIVVSPAAIVADVVSAMNASGLEKTDLSGLAFAIECKDGVIASNSKYAAELVATGKVVSVLSLTDGVYTFGSYNKVPAQITNLPDELAYGVEPIKLAFNQEWVEASINPASDVAELDENGVLTILKPGEVTISLNVKKQGAGSDYDDELAAEQKLTVTKRIATLTAGLAVNYAEDKTSKEYDGTKKVSLTLTDELKFAGMLGGNEGTGLKLAGGFTGTLADANVGENKPVAVTATLAGDSAEFYQLAPITFVKATVTPKEAIVTANDASRDYGKANPTFTATATGLVDGELIADLDGALRFICNVSTNALAGNYTDSIIPYGLTSPNYNITFGSGTLTINVADPEIEIVEAKTIINGANRDIQLKAKLVHKGGSSAEPSAVQFQYTCNGNQQGSVDAMKGDDGLYAATIVNAQGAYSIKASVTVGEKISTCAPISVTIDELIPQSLTWAPSVLPTLVYGQTMTLGATSDKAAATGKFRFDVDKSGNAKIEDGVLKPLKVGKVTIWAVREPDENYSVAMLAKTIEITPKPITVSVSGLEKVYDGNTTIATPEFTLSGVEGNDAVAVNTYGVTLSYASKNAGDNIPVILPELTLTGDAADNYTLVQPQVTGKITKAPLTIKVKDVTRPWDQRYTKYGFETTGLVNGETLAQAYTGTLLVAEVGDELQLTVENNKSQNYNVTAKNGKLNLIKGTPKALIYGDESSLKAMIVDSMGHTGLQLDKTGNLLNFRADGKLNVLDANGNVLTTTINSKPSTSSASLLAAAFSLRAASLRGTITPAWNVESFTSVAYGSEAMTFSPQTGFTYSSTNMSVLTVSADASSVTVTPVGVGNATIIAESTGEVKIWNVKVTPKPLDLIATMIKTYDGTATATGTVSLGTGIVGTDDVALDLSGITFNYEDKNVGDSKAIVPSQNLVLIGTNANNYAINAEYLSGKINPKPITVNEPIAVYYNGQTVHTLTTYPVSGLLAGDVAPITVHFVLPGIGTNKSITTLNVLNPNYELSASGNASKGTIQRSTLVATLPASASSVADLKSRIQLQIRETGETVTANAVGFNPTITTSGSGANTVYYVTGSDTDNYSVVYDRNQIGYQAPVIPGGGGGTVDPDPVIPTVSNPVVAERTATTATVTWEKVSGATSYKLFLYEKKTDSTPLKTYEFDKDGKLKATAISFTLTGLEEGKAYYVETAAYNALGTLLVKKSVELSATPTGIEAISEGSQLYTVKGAIVVAPAEPLQVAIYSVTGHTLFYDEVSYLTQVPAKAGIYVVVIQKGKERVMEKVFVR